jgi:hypothetical protein
MNIKSLKGYIPESLWEFFRLKAILRYHKRTAKLWHNFLDAYAAGQLEVYDMKPKQPIDSRRIIWQYWSQGLSNQVLPEMVKLCFDSVDRYKGDFEVIRLSDDNIHEWIDLPNIIMEKYQSGLIGKAHFSDIIRLALLVTYGGLWLDATILLTGPIPKYVTDADWFMYQRSDKQEDQVQWRRTYAYYFGWHKDFKVRLLNSVIFSKENNKVIYDLYQLLLAFWKVEKSVPDYFFFQILFTEYINRHPNVNCMVVSDCLPNMLQCYMTGSYTENSIQEILSKISIHKLSYKTVTPEQMNSLNL